MCRPLNTKKVQKPPNVTSEALDRLYSQLAVIAPESATSAAALANAVAVEIFDVDKRSLASTHSSTETVSASDCKQFLAAAVDRVALYLVGDTELAFAEAFEDAL